MKSTRWIQWVSRKRANRLLSYWSLCMVIPVILTSGCSFLKKEVNVAVHGNQTTLNASFRRSLLTSANGLNALDFRVLRIELPEQKGLIRARGLEKDVTLEFEPLSHSATKVMAKVIGPSDMRDYDTEKRILKHIESVVSSNENANLSRITQDMVSAYKEPKKASRIVAYIASGAEVDISDEKGPWCRIELELNTSAYVPKKDVNLLPNQWNRQN